MMVLVGGDVVLPDRILTSTSLIIDKGRIVQSGRHDQLLEDGGLYAELYRTQFAGPVKGGAAVATR